MLAVKTIIHATDFSPQADQAFHLACALARDYGARLVLLHVIEIRTAVYGEFGAFPVDIGDDKKVLQDKLNRMSAKFDRSAAFLAEGAPATEIVDRAKREHADLIVLGTHGRTGLGRLLMGSVAEQVVRTAHCPVLTVKSAPNVSAQTSSMEPAAVGHE